MPPASASTLPAAGFGCVIFDCDSTLSDVEGIEELARSHRAEIAALTERAMSGAVPLEQVYAHRMDLVRPSRERLEALGRLYAQRTVEDAREVCSALQQCGIQVRIVSGGLLPAVRHLAEVLGVDVRHVAAVDVYFSADGAYASFDAVSPLARSMGKLDILTQWADELPKPVMLVGDGSTDAEAAPAVELFVAYAGVHARPDVIAKARQVVRSRSLAPIFAIAVGERLLPSPELNALRDKGLQLMSGDN